MRSALQEEIRELRTRFRSERDPAGRAFATLADAYRRAGELDEAADLVEEGMARLPEYAPGHLVAARILHDRGDRRGAIAAFERVLRLDPENVEALRGAARLREDTGDTGVALEYWQRLLRADPGAPGLREHVRELKRRHYGVDEPAEQEAVAEPPVADGASADALSRENGGSEAPNDGPERSGADAAADPSDADAEPEELYTRTMGELYARQGLPERALAVYRKLVAREPDDVGLRTRLEELEREVSRGAPPHETAESVEPALAEVEDAPAPEGASAHAPAGESVEAYFRRMLAWPDPGETAG